MIDRQQTQVEMMSPAKVVEEKPEDLEEEEQSPIKHVPRPTIAAYYHDEDYKFQHEHDGEAFVLHKAKSTPKLDNLFTANGLKRSTTLSKEKICPVLEEKRTMIGKDFHLGLRERLMGISKNLKFGSNAKYGLEKEKIVVPKHYNPNKHDRDQFMMYLRKKEHKTSVENSEQAIQMKQLVNELEMAKAEFSSSRMRLMMANKIRGKVMDAIVNENAHKRKDKTSKTHYNDWIIKQRRIYNQSEESKQKEQERVERLRPKTHNKTRNQLEQIRMTTKMTHELQQKSNVRLFQGKKNYLDQRTIRFTGSSMPGLSVSPMTVKLSDQAQQIKGRVSPMTTYVPSTVKAKNSHMESPLKYTRTLKNVATEKKLAPESEHL